MYFRQCLHVVCHVCVRVCVRCLCAIVIALAFLPAVFGLGPATFSGLPFEWLALFCVFAHCLPNDFACCCSCLLPFVACFSLFLYFFLLHPKTLFVALVVFVVYHFWVNRAEFRAVYWTVKTMGKPSQAAAASTASFQLQLQLRLPRLRSTPTPVPVSRGFCFVSQFFHHFNKFLFLVLFFFVYLSQVLIAKYFIMQSRLTDWLWGLIITIAIN